MPSLVSVLIIIIIVEGSGIEPGVWHQKPPFLIILFFSGINNYQILNNALLNLGDALPGIHLSTVSSFNMETIFNRKS